MAVKLTKTTLTARVLVVSHIIVGFLLVCFGIREYVLETPTVCFMYLGIWTGIWMMITGGTGIPATRKEPSTLRNAFAGLFFGFSITSAVLGVLIAICYGRTVGFFPPHAKSITVIIILSIIESVIGVWTVVCLCLMNPFTCCCTPAQQASSDGPVAFSRYACSYIEEHQTFTPDAQDNQPQIFPPHEAVGSGHQTWQVDMPPSYEEAARDKYDTYV